MQCDLQPPMKIDKAIQNGQDISFTSEGNAHFLELQQPQEPGKEQKLTLFFSGKPRVAKRPPWDGGFTWTKDSNGKDFIATSNQGIGASVWWPLKDHPADEPDKGVTIAVTAPKDLMDVSNGRLKDVTKQEHTKTWVWEVVNPINAYGVNINIGDYVHWSEKYQGLNGTLDMDYYVLRENVEKAKEQFKQAPMMMEAFEHWFGPYPFYEDGYKLVEVPYLGMEHQSSVTYGNGFQNGYLGRDLSGTDWGLKFDYILVHESAHEWFANNITYRDIADMWIHESFTTYAEGLYLDYHFGKDAAAEYTIGTRANIRNNSPIIGPYEVNQRGSGDMYPKGANMLHTLRQLLEDDEKWRSILRGLNKEFYHQTVTTQQIEDYISKRSGIDLTAFFNQYLRTAAIPMLQYEVDGKQVRFRYTDIVDDFDMPVKIKVDHSWHWIYPTANWKTKVFDKNVESIKVDKNFYIASHKL